MICNSATLETFSELIKKLEDNLGVRIEFEFDDTFKCRIIKNAECIKEFDYPKISLIRLVLDLQKFAKELEEKQEEELFISKVMGCIGKFEGVFRFMRELEKRFSIRLNVKKDMDIAKVRIEAIRIATGEMIDAFEYHIVEPDRIQSDMEDLEKKLIETDRATKAKEIVKSLDDYARSKGWNCYFGNLENCKNSAMLKAVLLHRKEKYPRFVSFCLDDSIKDIKEQIKGIRLN